MSRFVLINGVYVIDKDPQSELDYGVRMWKWLVPGDLIDTTIPPVWELSTGLTQQTTGVSPDKQTAFIKLAGGVIDPDGSLEWALCTWWTVQGRKEQQTLYFNMVSK